MPIPRRHLFPALALAVLAAAPAAAQQQDTTPVRVVPVARGVWMLVGAGGNIGVSAGDDGVFLVDDQYAPATERVRRAVAQISPRPIRFVLNTHWHGDHTGGNENLGNAGALIVAHENVRRRMGTEQFIEAMNMRVEPSPGAALPVVTFTEAVTFHLNADSIDAFHVPPAHTDGDAIVRFRGANVLHMGDIFFNGAYPFVDRSSGGSVQGVIGAVERALSLADADTKVIPGHGPLGDRAALEAYHRMLVTARDRVREAVRAGRTLEQAKAADLLADLNPTWGRGFIRPDVFVETLYRELSAR